MLRGSHSYAIPKKDSVNNNSNTSMVAFGRDTRFNIFCKDCCTVFLSCHFKQLSIVFKHLSTIVLISAAKALNSMNNSKLIGQAITIQWNKSEKIPRNAKLIIRNLDKSINAPQLENLCLDYGKIENVEVIVLVISQIKCRTLIYILFYLSLGPNQLCRNKE